MDGSEAPSGSGRQDAQGGPPGLQRMGSIQGEKKRICFTWKSSGMCQFGSSCRFAHNEEHAYIPPDYQHRLWSHAQASTSGSERSPVESSWDFSLMSYNVLAAELALTHAKELYRAVPEWCLHWPTRIVKLMDEILHWSADIICLQEIDHPDDFISPLAAQGYEWKYAPRTGGRNDGCLTLWRRDKFTCRLSDTIKMEDHGLRDNVGLIVVLKAHTPAPTTTSSAPSPPPDPSPTLVVANTHLLFNPKRGDIKMGQAGIILRRIHALCGEHGIAPLAIFCGDFNSTPQSGICDFIKQGELDCYMANRQTLSGQLESREKGWPPGGGSGRRTSDGGRSTSLDFNWKRAPYRRRHSNPDHFPPPSPRGGMPPTSPHQPAGRPYLPQGISHSESFTCISEVRQRGGNELLRNPVGSCSMTATPRQPTMYPYTDQFGQVAWSHIPPASLDIARRPFYHEPMRVEEARPPPPPSPPPGIIRTLSFAERQSNVGTWTTEQLMIATGVPLPPGVGTQGSSRLPHPVSTDVWVAEHPVPMQSSYEAVLGGEPSFTSCHGKFIGTVDFVWYTPEVGHLTLVPTAVLLPPPLESLHCGLPSPEWPSDHISLLTKFTIRVHAQPPPPPPSPGLANGNHSSSPLCKHIYFD